MPSSLEMQWESGRSRPSASSLLRAGFRESQVVHSCFSFPRRSFAPPSHSFQVSGRRKSVPFFQQGWQFWMSGQLIRPAGTAELPLHEEDFKVREFSLSGAAKCPHTERDLTGNGQSEQQTNGRKSSRLFMSLVCPAIWVSAPRTVNLFQVAFHGRLADPEHGRELAERERGIGFLSSDNTSPQSYSIHPRVALAIHADQPSRGRRS